MRGSKCIARINKDSACVKESKCVKGFERTKDLPLKAKPRILKTLTRQVADKIL